MRCPLGIGLLGRPGGSAPADPTSVSGLVSWYRTYTGSPSNALWTDTVSGNNLVQATPGFQPVFASNWKNSKPSFLFNQVSGKFMQTAAFAGGAIANATILLVGDYGTGTVYSAIVDGIGASNRNIIEVNMATPALDIYAGSSTTPYTFTNDTKAHRFAAVFNGASSIGYLDGVSRTTGAAGAQSLTGLTLGGPYNGSAANCFNGNVGEVIIYNRVLTPAEIAKLDTYLVGQWGTA